MLSAQIEIKAYRQTVAFLNKIIRAEVHHNEQPFRTVRSGGIFYPMNAVLKTSFRKIINRNVGFVNIASKS